MLYTGCRKQLVVNRRQPKASLLLARNYRLNRNGNFCKKNLNKQCFFFAGVDVAPRLVTTKKLNDVSRMFEKLN